MKIALSYQRAHSVKIVDGEHVKEYLKQDILPTYKNI